MEVLVIRGAPLVVSDSTNVRWRWGSPLQTHEQHPASAPKNAYLIQEEFAGKG